MQISVTYFLRSVAIAPNAPATAAITVTNFMAHSIKGA